jgi:hypothetical protein
MYEAFLKWRDANNIDEIRRNIVEGGMDHPSKFPGATEILAGILS